MYMNRKMYIPPELLEIIFQQVQIHNKFTSGVDLLHASEACDVFQSILEPTKCVWLFKEVLPFIVSTLNGNRRTLLTLRQVCKGWKRTVDHFLENSEYYLAKVNLCPYHHIPGYSRINFDPSHLPLPKIKILKHITSLDSLARILDGGCTASGMRLLIGGGLSLSTLEGTDKLNFYDRVTELLVLIGEQVLFLEVNSTSYPAERFIQCLFQHLSLTPNIKSLTLCFSETLEGQEVQRGQNLRPPKLPNLETFALNCGPGNNFPQTASQILSTLFLKFGKQLRKLTLVGINLTNFMVNCFHSRALFLLRLTHLELHLNSEQQISSLAYLLKQCRHLTHFTLYCVGQPENWPAAKNLLFEPLLPALNPFYMFLDKLRIFWKLPEAVLVGKPGHDACNKVVFRLLREMTYLRCLHLQNFTFATQAFLIFLPSSLKCLVLDRVTFQDVKCKYHSRPTFYSFLADTRQTIVLEQSAKIRLPRLKYAGWQELVKCQNVEGHVSSERCQNEVENCLPKNARVFLIGIIYLFIIIIFISFIGFLFEKKPESAISHVTKG